MIMQHVSVPFAFYMETGIVGIKISPCLLINRLVFQCPHKEVKKCSIFVAYIVLAGIIPCK